MTKPFLRVGSILTLALLLLQCTPSPRFRTTPSKPSHTTSHRTKTVKPDLTPPPLSTTLKVGQSFVGVASFYGKEFQGRLTANGETFDMYGITAAHKTLPFNTVIRVTNLNNDKSTLVRINDRGPFVPGRILDLSYGAARKLGMVAQGTVKVRIEIVELGDNEYVR